MTLGPYFDDLMVARQRLLWTVATRRQLERWEPLVARFVRADLDHRPIDGGDVWIAAIEHHFTLIAVRNLFRALDLAPPESNVSVDPTLRAELIEGRDLNEHWVDNMPVFNVMPRTAQPKYATGQRFAARNPRNGPYNWESWSNTTGAMLTPHASAPALHDVLDAVEAEAVSITPSLRDYVPARAPSPWLRERDEWWPKPMEALTSGTDVDGVG